jgi:predicted nuclease of predicted toxin-antitoxin system
VSKIRYYTDEHVAKTVIRGLRQRGVDVLTTPGANKLHASDEAHLKFALLEQRVIFTQDDDFLKLAAAGKEHAGIVYAPQHVPTGRII